MFSTNTFALPDVRSGAKLHAWAIHVGSVFTVDDGISVTISDVPAKLDEPLGTRLTIVFPGRDSLVALVDALKEIALDETMPCRVDHCPDHDKQRARLGSITIQLASTEQANGVSSE